MKTKKNTPIGTPNPKNPNILEWVSEDGKRMLQFISSYGHYRFCRACSNGNWIVETRISQGGLEFHLKTLNKQWN